MDIIHSMDDDINNIITMGPKDHQSMIIIKGKRTKRPRQPSPASAVFTASSCSSGGHTKIPSSESLCSEILSSSTDEDEDMANCLILLAHSGRQNKMSINNIAKQEGVEITKSDKISSKKIKEVTTTSSTLGGKDGKYVYECKTCNRSFASFQALGGHRTSHKKHKPKVEIEIEEKKAKNTNDHHHNQEKNQHEEDERRIKHFKICNNIVINNNIKVKIHECSICGAEFASGQALGGHMRRHRTTPTNAATTATGSSQDEGGERRRNILEVDLNLPAPPEDDDLFQFSLFSSPTLVDCQY